MEAEHETKTVAIQEVRRVKSPKERMALLSWVSERSKTENTEHFRTGLASWCYGENCFRAGWQYSGRVEF